MTRSGSPREACLRALPFALLTPAAPAPGALCAPASPPTSAKNIEGIGRNALVGGEEGGGRGGGSPLQTYLGHPKSTAGFLAVPGCGKDAPP